MTRSLAQFRDSMTEAQAITESLHDRVTRSRNVEDLGDLSVLQTTTRKIQELLDLAEEYEGILRRRIASTKTRLEENPL